MDFKYFQDIPMNREELQSSVLELRQYSDIEKFTVKKEKVTLPRNGNLNKGYCIFYLNTPKEAIVKVLNNEHNLIMNQSSGYKGYYYFYRYLRTVIRNQRIKNCGIGLNELKMDRIADYGDIQLLSSNISTPADIRSYGNKNFVYDLEPVIRVMKVQKKLEKISLVEKLRTFFDTISYAYRNAPVFNYKKGPIYIDLESQDTTCNLNNYQFIDYMMVMLRKSETVIEKIMANIPTMEIFLYSSKGYIKLDTKTDLTKENYFKLVKYFKRLTPKLATFDKAIDNTIKKDFDSKINMKMNLTGNDVPDDGDPTVGAEIVSKKVELVKDKAADEAEKIEAEKVIKKHEDEDELIDEVVDELEEDEELKSSYIKSITNKKAGTKSEASLKRDALLREQQMKIKMNGKTIGELVKDIPTPPPIEETKIDTDVTSNEELKNVKFYNFESTYINECFDRDMARAITSFNDKGINVNVTNVTIEDTSTELIYQDTYTIELEDENRKRHTMKVNIPKLVDDKYLIINGKKRVIEKQLVGLPIIKTGPNEVQIVTNYNKLWIYRMGSRMNPNMERFKKVISDESKRPEGTKVRIYKGDNSVVNQKYLTCLEYDELAALYNKVVVNDCTFVFSVDMLKEELGDKYKDSALETIIIGYKGSNKTPIVYNTKNPDHQDLVSLMVHESMPNFYDEFKKLSSGRKYIHNRMKIMEKLVPVIFIITFFEGLSTVVQKFNALNGSNQVEFVDKKNNADNYMYIRFADGYLRYPMNNLEACILFNGFTELELKDITFAEMDDRDTYLEIFDRLLGSAYYVGGIINYYDFMIDYKTLDILKLLHYPEDIVSLIIYASNMLADSSYTIDTDPRLYRLRDAEIIPAILYKEMTKSYSRYRKTANNANPAKLTMNPDCVIKTLNELPTVSSYSTLSPIVEVNKFGIASMKGQNGMNLDRSYTEEKRNYHDNMIGIVGISTDIAKNCGKERHLVLEPNVVNAYGMLDIKGREAAKDMDATKLMTAEELTYPMGVPHDDPNRTAMTSKQSCHAIPVMDQSPCLITNGFDSMIHYRTSNDFSYVAKQDGQVVDIDTKTNIMIVKYKDGTVHAIDLDEKTVQNGGGGFYLRNKLDTTFKKGDKFKKDAILAFDKNYYKDTGIMGNKLTYGSLVKSACLSNYSTYEDSTWTTYRAARSLSSDITMLEVETVIGKNSAIDFIVKKGDKVKNGEDLLRFDTSYTDAEMNELLNNIRADLQEDIVNLGKSKFTSKHDGVVADVRVYPAIPKEEMSPTLRKMVNDIQSHERDRRKFMDKYDKNKNSVYRKGIYFNNSADVIQPDRFGKIRGHDASDGVLIEIYVTYHDEVSDGDKFAHMSANKATNGAMIPRGFEPYTLARPYEEIDIPLAPSAILQRGTPSIVTVTVGYKVLIELKRKMFELLTGKDWNDKAREDRPYMDCHGPMKLKPMKESVDFSGVNVEKLKFMENRFSMLESIFELEKTPDNTYMSSRNYSTGDIVISGLNFKDELNRAMLESRLSTVEEGFYSNIRLDEDINAYVATEPIFHGERFVL